MQTMNKAEMAFLAMLAYPELMNRTLRLYAKETYLFNEYMYPHIVLMLTAYMNLRKREGKDPSRQLIASELIEVVQRDGSQLSKDMLRKCDQILSDLVEDRIPDYNESRDVIKHLIKLETNRKIGSLITDNADLDELQRSLDSSRKLIDAIGEDSGKDKIQVMYKPFAEINKLVKHVDRIPTGINWLDEITNGGGRAGELWLWLGPSGGGKSVCAVQYSAAQALMGKYTLWATFEQSLEGDLSERLVANVTGCSLDRIRDSDYGSLGADIRDKFESAIIGAQDKLVALDMSRAEINPADPKDVGGMYSVWKYVTQLRKEGTPVQSVIIDWMGALLLNVSGHTGQSLDKQFRFMSQAEIDVARKMAKEENVLVIIFHQTDTTSQHAKPTYCPDKTCAKDDHAMCNYFDLTITMGTKDENDILWINPAKTRKANTRPITARLRGEFSKMEAAPGWLPDRSGKFYNREAMASVMKAQAESKPKFKRDID